MFTKFLYNFYLNQKGIKLDHNSKMLSFIGAPRSGTTFLCYLLSMHPDLLISNESRLIHNVIARNKDFELEKLKSNFLACRQLTNKKLINTNIQQKWNYADHIISKNSIKVFGDKKAGGTTILFQSQKKKFIDFVENKIDFLIFIYRDPISSSISHFKSHSHESQKIEQSFNRILNLNFLADQIAKIFPEKTIKISYSNLIKNKVTFISEISKLFNFFKINLTEDYINTILRIPNFSPNTDHQHSQHHFKTLYDIFNKNPHYYLKEYKFFNYKEF